MKLSNLPPGVTDAAIERQVADDEPALVGEDGIAGPDGVAAPIQPELAECTLEEFVPPAKQKYPNALAEMWNETLFSRIRAGNFKGFRGIQPKRHSGVSARTHGREIERLKEMGMTPKQGRGLVPAHGLGSINVESDAVELARVGKYPEAIKLLESWQPYYLRHHERKAYRLEFWRTRAAQANLVVIDDIQVTP